MVKEESFVKNLLLNARGKYRISNSDFDNGDFAAKERIQNVIRTKRNTICRIAAAAGGLLVCALGIHLTILANIGAAPWDTLCLGITRHLPLIYGTASLLVSVCVLGVDLLLKERIGVGTVLDAVLTGKAVDFYRWLDWIPHPQQLTGKIACMVLGMLIIAVGQWLYMRTGLGCGPRDSLLLALGKRARRLPIGAVNGALLLAVLTVGWLLSGPIGLGTVLTALGLGPAMQLVFRAVRFEPRNVAQEDLVQTLRGLTASFKERPAGS